MNLHKYLFIEFFFSVEAESSTSVLIYAKIQIPSPHATSHSMHVTYASSQKNRY